jgi:hypothetical protein
MTMLPESIGTTASLGGEIIIRIEEIVRDSERHTRPLEMEPYRGQLFELFVTAEGAGFLDEGAETDLSADGLCRRLAERLGLRDAALDARAAAHPSGAAAASVERQIRLPERHLAKMRQLWSVMRMWMEWTYAWQRWPEFHRDETNDRSS